MVDKSKIKRLAQLTEIRHLYECKLQCLKVVSFIVMNNIKDKKMIDSLLDDTVLCNKSTIRDFICTTLPEMGNCCVPPDVDNRIKALKLKILGECRNGSSDK